MEESKDRKTPEGEGTSEATEEEKTETVDEYIDGVEYLYEDETDRDSFRKKHKFFVKAKALALGAIGFVFAVSCFGIYQTANYGYWKNSQGKTAFMVVYPNSQKAVKAAKAVHGISESLYAITEDDGNAALTKAQCTSCIEDFEGAWTSAGDGFEWTVSSDSSGTAYLNYTFEADSLFSGSENLSALLTDYVSTDFAGAYSGIISEVYAGTLVTTGTTVTSAEMLKAYEAESDAYEYTMNTIFGI